MTMDTLDRLNENTKLQLGEQTVRKIENLAKDRIKIEGTDAKVIYNDIAYPEITKSTL